MSICTKVDVCNNISKACKACNGDESARKLCPEWNMVYVLRDLANGVDTIIEHFEK